MGSVAWSVCMATTGWGLIYFNLLNIFNLYNLHTSLPLSARSARSARHPHSSRPFVICCTAQSTFLPISRFPVLSPAETRSRRTFPGLSPAEKTISCTAKKAICVNSCGQNRENNLCQFSRGWRVEKKVPFRAPWFLLDFHSQNEKRFIGQHSNGSLFWDNHFLYRPVVPSDHEANQITFHFVPSLSPDSAKQHHEKDSSKKKKKPQHLLTLPTIRV